jgi:hypothetical protein
MIRVLPQSSSIVLRATHILLVRVDAAETGEWLQTPAGLQRPLSVTVTLMEVLKGTLQQHEGDQFTVQTEQFRITSLWFMPTPGVWSEQPLEAGTKLVAFCRTDSDHAPEMVKDPFCEKLIVAGSALLDVRLARQAETERLTLAALYERAKPDAASLTYIFTEYLWEAYRTIALQETERFEELMQFLEEPNLSSITRSTLLTPIYSKLITGTVNPLLRNRFAIALIRLLDLPAAATLHDNIISTYLPNLLGLPAGVDVKAAAEVLKDYPADRAKIEEVLQKYSGDSSTEQLLGWLKKED